jgi:AraC-like DNA-binding protein
MQFQFFDAIAFIGLINALVFAGIILYKKPSTASNQLLSGILLVLGLLCAKILIHTLGLWQTTYFRYFPLGIDLWLPPLLFLYVLALTEPQKLHKSLILKHLSLPIVFLVYTFVVYFSTVFIENLAQKTSISNAFFYGEIKLIEDVLSVILGIYYGFLAYRQLQKYQRWVETYISNTAVPTYQWLLSLLFFTAFVLFLLGLMLSSQHYQIVSPVPILLFYFYLVFLIYVFGFFGFKHQDFKTSLELISKKSEAVSNIQSKELLEKFERLVQTAKPYLEPDLNLNQCAEQLKCSSQNLSEAINLSNFKNFRDCINHFRVIEFKERIQQANLKKETILGIAFESGFNSEPSFYRIFKEKTGLTPREFVNISSQKGF